MSTAGRSPGRDREAKLRVSNADRDEAVAQLREHHVAGRLELDEFADRVQQALSSKTRLELERLFGDLPATGGSGPPRRSPSAREFRRHLAAHLAGCAGLAWAAGQFGIGLGSRGDVLTNWFLVPLAGGGVGLMLHAWAVVRERRGTRPSGPVLVR